MDADAGTPPGLDADVPSIARVADYLLGGKDNFAADRHLVDELLAVAPEFKSMSADYLAFNERSVRHLAQAGIRQFINLAAKLPTRLNTHEIAQSVAPGATVAYVASDPVVLTHARAIMGRDPNTVVIEGELRRPGELFADARLREAMDLDQPVAVLIGGLLQYIPDAADPFSLVARLRDALPAGSHLALSHVVFEPRPELIKPISDIYRRLVSTRSPSQDQVGELKRRRRAGLGRTPSDLLRFFDGFELLEPGLVPARQWRPDVPPPAEAPPAAWLAAGVGRKAPARG